jgi:glycosyltransferase involved in cell wall biosynthesis
MNVGGPAQHVAWLTSGLRGAGFESVLVTGSVPATEDDMGYFAAAEDVQPIVIPELSRELGPKDAVVLWKIYRLLCRLQPDVIHTHTAKAGAVGRAAAMMYRWLTPATLIGRPRRVRVVHTYHGHIFHSYYGRLKTRVFLAIERALARLATDRLVVISPQQFREIHDTFAVGRAGQYAIVPLGLDLSRFAGAAARRSLLRSELACEPDDLLVGIVGRLTEVKNHPMFLQVADRYRRQYAEALGRRVRFVVIGGGQLEPQLRAQALALGLADEVIFLGLRTDPENFYPGLDVLALTSLNEGTPLSILEAMAAERPTISTQVGGVVDLLGSPHGAEPAAGDYALCQRGITVRSGDVDGFCKGLDRMLRDERLRADFGRRGREFVENGYTKERLVRDVEQVYESLIPWKRQNPAAPAATGSAYESIEG